MKSDIIAKVVSALGGIPRHVGTKDGYEEVVKTLSLLDLVVEPIKMRDLEEIGLFS